MKISSWRGAFTHVFVWLLAGNERLGTQARLRH